MNYEKVKFNCISNGQGIRTALFVTGCEHYCKGCFNYQIWNPNTGETFTPSSKSEVLTSIDKPQIAGLSLLGGEPMMEYNLDELIKLCEEFRMLFGDTKTIWIYSGWTFDELIKHPRRLKLLKLCDVLVDGPYEQDLYSPLLRFRGSSNQRIIDLKETFKLDEHDILGDPVVVLHKTHNEIPKIIPKEI